VNSSFFKLKTDRGAAYVVPSLVIGGELLDDPLTAETANAAVVLSTKRSNADPRNAVASCPTRTFIEPVHGSFHWRLTALHFLPESETLIGGNPIQARPVVAEPTLTQAIITGSIDRHPRFWRAVYAVDRAPRPRTKCFLRGSALHRLAR
jgi:hypothetical protein